MILYTKFYETNITKRAPARHCQETSVIVCEMGSGYVAARLFADSRGNEFGNGARKGMELRMSVMPLLHHCMQQ